MDDVLDNSADVTVTLSEIEVTETGGVLIEMSVRLELEDMARCVRTHCHCTINWFEHTMACERLCARMTRPIAFSSGKEQR